jgi:hypothetical protein
MCPSLIATRWLYIIDVLDFILQNRNQINSYLLIQHELDPFILVSVPKEFFELHAILLPFKIMLSAAESHDCILSEIVPLSRKVQANLRAVCNILETETSRPILQIFLAQFYARLLTNNHDEAIAAYLLMPLGREELRVEQKGYQTIRSDLRLPIWRPARNSPDETPFEPKIVDLMNAILNASVIRDSWPGPWQDAETKAIDEDLSESEIDADTTHGDGEPDAEDDSQSDDESEEDDADENHDLPHETEELLSPLTVPGYQRFLNSTGRLSSD